MNDDLDKYGYSSHGIGFDARLRFSWSGSGFGKDDFIFGVNSSSSVHDDNKKGYLSFW